MTIKTKINNDNDNETVNAFEATKYIKDKMTFGSLVRAIRICDEISQVKLAEKLMISKQFLSNVENGHKEVGFSFAKKVAKILGYPPAPFLELVIKDQLKRNKLNYIVKLETP